MVEKNEGQPKSGRGHYSLEQYRAYQRDRQKAFVEYALKITMTNISEREKRALNRKARRVNEAREALLTQLILFQNFEPGGHILHVIVP